MIRGFEPHRLSMPAGGSHFQWRAGIAAGLIPGLILLIVPRGSPWEGLTSYTSVVMGRVVPSSWGAFSMTVILIHLAVSIWYGLMISLTVTNVRQMKAVLTGGIAGLALYLFNFGVVTLWVPQMRGGEVAVAVTHLVFGLIAAGAYRGLLKREPVPSN